MTSPLRGPIRMGSAGLVNGAPTPATLPFALTPRSLNDFDWLAALDTTTYSVGAPPLEGFGADA